LFCFFSRRPQQQQSVEEKKPRHTKELGDYQFINRGRRVSFTRVLASVLSPDKVGPNSISKLDNKVLGRLIAQPSTDRGIKEPRD
jgi:hypothetical protein